MDALPSRLKKYIVAQNYERYTPVDQAVWRYVLRQLKDFLGTNENAHQAYLDGLEKTGIEIETIPHIEIISKKLEKFGWRALPVSGFIPPAVFMELQALSILPIASDMRTIDHLLYTPAPDIVHEAAGHAPIIVDPEYAAYLKEYSQVAKKAIISQEDLNLYEAIRDLSDIKENALSTPEQIKSSEERLQKTAQSISHVSEASELSRMNWWTAEYGLVGSMSKPKIFGAGLLSSVGESKWCLSDKVKKIPLTLECIKQNYDITEPQPQLFVTPDFKTLVKVLHELAAQMAYKVGGVIGLQKAVQAKSINTVEFENRLQISGVLEKFFSNHKNEPIFLKFSGPTQISYKDHQVLGHNKDYHQNGYSTPMGSFKPVDFQLNSKCTLEYISGVRVEGVLTHVNQVGPQAQILTFSNALVTYNGQTLFQPDWGNYDLIIANKVTSVFGGPADPLNYGETEDFVAARVPTVAYTNAQKAAFELYQKVRTLRQSQKATLSALEELFQNCFNQAPQQWLLFVELLELAYQIKADVEFTKKLEFHLTEIKTKNANLTSVIDDGIRLAHA